MKKIIITAVIIAVILLVAALAVNASGWWTFLNWPLNKIVAGTPDESCYISDDCKIATTSCAICDCGSAVNKNWQAYCPFKNRQRILCETCIDSQAICLNYKCRYQPAAPVADAVNSFNLQTQVIDNNSGVPIKDAIVYLGKGFYFCLTDETGKCIINSGTPGSYGFTVYKKGYERFFQHEQFVRGDNTRTAELKPAPQAPVTYTISGTIIENISYPGTLSENHFFKIKQANGQEDYIFNQLGYNNPPDDSFKKFVDKKVMISGYRDKGFIGWAGEKVEGIYVESISLNK